MGVGIGIGIGIGGGWFCDGGFLVESGVGFVFAEKTHEPGPFVVGVFFGGGGGEVFHCGADFFDHWRIG